MLTLFPFIIFISTAAAQCIPSTTTLLKPYQKCLVLPTQGATFSWTYHARNATLDASFSGAFISPSGWVAWGINPDSPQMTGTRSLAAFSDPTTSSLLLLPFLLDPSVKLQTSPPVSRRFGNLLSSSATVLSSRTVQDGARVEIRAVLRLNPNHTKINLVWNRGLYVQGYSPTIHPTTATDLNSRAVVDLLSSHATVEPATAASIRMLRPAHAVLNALSWGFCLPVGALTARYLRQWPGAGPTWFYAHAAIQVPGFLMGVAGFVIGIVMGKASEGVEYGLHRALGIAAVCMGGLQAAAVMFRPGTTNRYRKYWKSYHHLVGYGCVVVGMVNVFQGFEVMGLGGSYVKLAYCLAVSTVAGAAVAMEANAWVVFCRKAEEEKVRREGSEHGGLVKGISRSF